MTKSGTRRGLALGQRPSKRGGRFSANAAIPSSRSWEANAARSSASISAPASGPSALAAATRLSARLWPCTVSGASAAISCARSRAAVSGSSANAGRARRDGFLRIDRTAGEQEVARRTLADEHREPRMLVGLRRMPSRPPGMASRASGPATRMSHATASCMPAPIAGPWIAAITGAG